MGVYKDGKWVPTFGDEQFGIIDTPAEMYERIRELEAENANMNNMDEVLNDWLERVQQAALRFKCKVERDAPDCFVPSRELQELFDVLDEDMDTK